MSTEGFHIDHEAARYGGIALMGTIGAIWLLRPDGTFWDVDDDFGKPLTPLPEDNHLIALVWGKERYPWLSELLPPRPADAVTCGNCRGLPVMCPECRGLGWRPAA
jgi:hypothetical protein